MNTLNYGVIGNCKSAALVSETGALEWLCLPQFDSSSVFAKLLDKEKGGSLEILVTSDYSIKQDYIPKTNILRTVFDNGSDSFELLDFMPRYRTETNDYFCPPEVIRFFKRLSGKPVFRVKYDPKLEYAAQETLSVINDDHIKSCTENGDYDSLYLYTNFDRKAILFQNEIELKKDSYILLNYNQKILNQTVEKQHLKLLQTQVYWLNWTKNLISYTHYDKQIVRSALVLKLLSYQKSGAVLAAATTSLPETIGEERNWDYRFCWIRDASMVIKVMADLGKISMVKRYMDFILDIIPDKDEKIQIMYGINGEKLLEEKELGHLSGYENSSPVRVGNAAYIQKQNDIFGILMDVIYQQFEMHHTSLGNSEELWTITRSIAKTVERNKDQPDKGIWEIRTGVKHFTFSKVLCWVAIDRAVKIAHLIHKNNYADTWQALADNIKADIHTHAWNDKVGAFTQSYGSEHMDAAVLLMEPYGFIDAKDPKYIATVKATEKELCRNGLMYRYKNEDDFGLPSSSFTICTFWFINALHAIGETKKAKSMFDTLLSYSNHVGLFSEDIDFESKRLLGNFPQAYSHLALIETAINISKGIKTEEEEILESLY